MIFNLKSKNQMKYYFYKKIFSGYFSRENKQVPQGLLYPFFDFGVLFQADVRPVFGVLGGG